MSMSHITLLPSPAISTLDRLATLLRSQGLSACARIDTQIFFHVSHSPALQCATVIDGQVHLAVQAVNDPGHLERLDLSDRVQRFFDRSIELGKVPTELVRGFLSGWINQVAARSPEPDCFRTTANYLVEVEHCLADDGPGSCVLLGPWIVWSAGRHGMSDLMIARNVGLLPAPDLATAVRWDAIGLFDLAGLTQLQLALQEWKEAPSVWAFCGRFVPLLSGSEYGREEKKLPQASGKPGEHFNDLVPQMRISNQS